MLGDALVSGEVGRGEAGKDVYKYVLAQLDGNGLVHGDHDRVCMLHVYRNLGRVYTNPSSFFFFKKTKGPY